ncbi:MAG: hypothetical protein IKI11_10715 [Neisseriaceae bacterium]|nr:hypothetical protein [Neisseriaceae bacterium]
MKKYILFLLAVVTFQVHAQYYIYYIQFSHDDELFIINDEKFEAKTYCFNMEEGDPVIFIDGNANGVCVSAEILNLRTKEVCSVWCE